MKLERKLKIIEKKIDKAAKNKDFLLVNQLNLTLAMFQHEIYKKKTIENEYDELFI
jgi:hypothetical protein